MTTDIQSGSWVNPNPPAPAKKPPPSEVGVLGWLRANLFSSVLNSIVTLLTAVFLYFALTALIGWIVTAFWEPIWANRVLFAVGTYPVAQLWQPALVLLGITLLFGLSAGRWGSIMRSLAIGLGALLGVLAVIPFGLQAQAIFAGALALMVAGYLAGLFLRFPSRLLFWAWILSLPLTFIVLKGGVEFPTLGVVWEFAPFVDSNLWGGLLITLLLAFTGIALSFPLGVLLALGRRSNLPVVKGFSVAYIELIRGVPLITILFMGVTMLPLFLPDGWGNPSTLIRVTVALALFSAAYLAENVRGGLQAIPKGQYEAADALGLSGFAKLRYIILPQALTKVIPALVGQFIGLFMDTSLASLVGLFELVNVAKTVINQDSWFGVPGGVAREVYVFVALIFFIFNFGMSIASRSLENKLGVGKR